MGPEAMLGMTTDAQAYGQRGRNAKPDRAVRDKPADGSGTPADRFARDGCPCTDVRASGPQVNCLHVSVLEAAVTVDVVDNGTRRRERRRPGPRGYEEQ